MFKKIIFSSWPQNSKVIQHRIRWDCWQTLQGMKKQNKNSIKFWILRIAPPHPKVWSRIQFVSTFNRMPPLWKRSCGSISNSHIINSAPLFRISILSLLPTIAIFLPQNRSPKLISINENVLCTRSSSSHQLDGRKNELVYLTFSLVCSCFVFFFLSRLFIFVFTLFPHLQSPFLQPVPSTLFPLFSFSPVKFFGHTFSK